MATRCHCWNAHSRHDTNNKNGAFQPQRHDRQRQQQQQHETTETGTIITRRRLFFESMLAAQVGAALVLPQVARASSSPSPAAYGVTVTLQSPRDALGIEIYDTMLRGNNVVVLRRVVVRNEHNRLLEEGMVLRPRNGERCSAQEFVQMLRSGPYPLEVDFINLAAGGDAISDLGSSIVTPKDALELAQQTEDTNQDQQQQQQQQRGGGYGITKLQETPPKACSIRSRRNDVLEIEYEASYIDGDTGRRVVYDASAFRGTGNRPYQMVLGSGDMLPGVDQGLYDMCPGDKRLLTIPPVLGHGRRSRKAYMIPDNYRNLEWEVSLVTIDSTIREDNNVVSRDDRESRFAY